MAVFVRKNGLVKSSIPTWKAALSLVLRNRLKTPRFKVSADGVGVASHAGVGMLREVAENSGLSDEITWALADTYKGPWIHAPGRVFTDLACAIADGADAVTGIEVLGDREDFFGPVASMPTRWRVLEKIDEAHLGRVRAARAKARERAWAAGASPDLGEDLIIDFDATIVEAHWREATREGDVEENVRVPPLGCVPGPPRHL